jgi:hypothetical protein
VHAEVCLLDTDVSVTAPAFRLMTDIDSPKRCILLTNNEEDGYVQISQSYCNTPLSEHFGLTEGPN